MTDAELKKWAKLVKVKKALNSSTSYEIPYECERRMKDENIYIEK